MYIVISIIRSYRPWCWRTCCSPLLRIQRRTAQWTRYIPYSRKLSRDLSFTDRPSFRIFWFKFGRCMLWHANTGIVQKCLFCGSNFFIIREFESAMKFVTIGPLENFPLYIRQVYIQYHIITIILCDRAKQSSVAICVAQIFFFFFCRNHPLPR